MQNGRITSLFKDPAFSIGWLVYLGCRGFHMDDQVCGPSWTGPDCFFNFVYLIIYFLNLISENMLSQCSALITFSSATCEALIYFAEKNY